MNKYKLLSSQLVTKQPAPASPEAVAQTALTAVPFM
jgi:hypothetical protein